MPRTMRFEGTMRFVFSCSIMLRILTRNSPSGLGGYMAITDWPEGERPREKLLIRGASSLSDAELLAIFLRTGVTGKSAVDLARELLTRFGSLTQLFATSEADFCAVHGMGQAKYVQLQAVLEMSRRALKEELQRGDALNSPRVVRDYLQLLLGGRQQEVFLVLFLDTLSLIHISEPTRRTPISYAVFCLKKK